MNPVLVVSGRLIEFTPRSLTVDQWRLCVQSVPQGLNPGQHIVIQAVLLKVVTGELHVRIIALETQDGSEQSASSSPLLYKSSLHEEKASKTTSVHHTSSTFETQANTTRTQNTATHAIFTFDVPKNQHPQGDGMHQTHQPMRAPVQAQQNKPAQAKVPVVVF